MSQMKWGTTMYFRISYCCIFLLLGFACAPKEVMYRQNVNFLYAPATAVQYDVLPEGDSLHLYLKFADKELFSHTAAPQVQYFFNLSYERSEITKRETIPNLRNKLKIYPGYVMADFKLKVPVNPDPVLLQLKIINSPEEKTAHYIDIPLTKEVLNRNFILTDTVGTPLFRNHVNLSETFWVKMLPNQAMPVQIKKFEGEFPAAAPPFSRLPKNVSSALTMSRSFQAAANEQIKLPEEGLYLMSVGNSSLGVVAEGNLYPELTTAKELIEPLIYITSAKERSELYAVTETKLALDQFWLQVANQNKELARQLIKTYYGRVKEANEFFGSHKAGWLTDRGMIYIIYGKPTIVNRYQQAEEWTYRNFKMSGGALKFNFSKKPNTFTQNHYELIRRPDYEFVWYSTVEKWRKGIIQEE